MSDKAILVVDDDEFVLFFVERALQHLGYTVACTSSCEEGLELYGQRHDAGAPFRAVITDISIPGGMGGEEFAAKLRERYPGVLVFVSSGHPEAPCMRDPARYGFAGSIHKPVTLESLTSEFIPVLERSGS
jgi:DNA-binding NtrC family response regulator